MNGRILKGDVWIEIFRQRHLKRREVKSRAGGVNPARLFCSAYAAGKEVTYWWAVLQAMPAVCRCIIMNEKIM